MCRKEDESCSIGGSDILRGGSLGGRCLDDKGAGGLLSNSGHPSVDANSGSDWAKAGVGCVVEEQNSFSHLLLLLGVPVDSKSCSKQWGARNCVGDWNFAIPEELKICVEEGHKGLGEQGKDLQIVVLGNLAPLRGSEAGVLAQDDPLINGHKGMIQGEGVHMHEHP